jgi:hypothetical protein
MNGRPMKGARLAFRVTFERFTPASVADGDAAERGFIVSGTLRDCVPEVCHGFTRPDWCGHAQPDSTRGRVRWLDWCDYSEDIRTGETETRALHIPPGITDASAARIVRLFRVSP